MSAVKVVKSTELIHFLPVPVGSVVKAENYLHYKKFKIIIF